MCSIGTCQPLPLVDNGLIAYSVLANENNEYLAGSVANYTCEDGFEIFGMSTRTCQRNMTWSGHEPCCHSEYTAVRSDSHLT